MTLGITGCSEQPMTGMNKPGHSNSPFLAVQNPQIPLHVRHLVSYIVHYSVYLTAPTI